MICFLCVALHTHWVTDKDAPPDAKIGQEYVPGKVLVDLIVPVGIF